MPPSLDYAPPNVSLGESAQRGRRSRARSAARSDVRPRPSSALGRCQRSSTVSLRSKRCSSLRADRSRALWRTIPSVTEGLPYGDASFDVVHARLVRPPLQPLVLSAAADRRRSQAAQRVGARLRDAAGRGCARAQAWRPVLLDRGHRAFAPPVRAHACPRESWLTLVRDSLTGPDPDAHAGKPAAPDRAAARGPLPAAGRQLGDGLPCVPVPALPRAPCTSSLETLTPSAAYLALSSVIEELLRRQGSFSHVVGRVHEIPHGWRDDDSAEAMIRGAMGREITLLVRSAPAPRSLPVADVRSRSKPRRPLLPRTRTVLADDERAVPAVDGRPRRPPQ